MSINEDNQPIASPIPQQRVNSPEFEREIYEKWLKKCQEDANYNRKASEQNNFERIKFGREVLNRVGQAPDPELTKLYTPYMQPGADGKNKLNISAYEQNINQRRNNEMNMIYILWMDSPDIIIPNFMKKMKTDTELKGEDQILRIY